jgi:hypothetical protein
MTDSHDWECISDEGKVYWCVGCGAIRSGYPTKQHGRINWHDVPRYPMVTADESDNDLDCSFFGDGVINDS